MLDLPQVRSFVSVIDTGSFHAAAGQLRLAQPTVSQHVQKLEAALGAALVVRSQTCCGPTPKGAAFLPHARRLLRAEEEARASVHSPRLVIGAASNLGIYLLPRLVSRFRKHVAGEPNVVLSIASNPVIEERLGRGDIDVAVMEWWGDLPGFEASIWRFEPIVVIVAPDHPWADRDTVSVNDLLAEPIIGGEPGTGTGRLLRTALGPEAMGRLSVAAELGSTEAVKHAVAAGLGVSLVLEAAVGEEVAAGSLRTIRVQGLSLRKPLFVALAERTPGTAPVAAFRDMLLQQHQSSGGVTGL